MEREDSNEHARANCSPIAEGQIFLDAMKKYTMERLEKKKKLKENNIDPILNRPAAPSAKNFNDFIWAELTWLGQTDLTVIFYQAQFLSFKIKSVSNQLFFLNEWYIYEM